MSTPTRAQILNLYRNYLATAQSFSSYNFRTYFLRRSRDLFRSNLLPASEVGYSSPFSKASGRTALASPHTLSSPAPSALINESSSSLSSSSSSSSSAAAKTAASGSDARPADREEKLRQFYQAAKKDLEVLRRAALTNRMYEGERLVVEKPVLIVGGGGAGAEASVGGAGQPGLTDQGKGGAPPSGSSPPQSS